MENNKFAMPASNVIIEATFKRIQYEVKINAPEGTVTSNKATATAGEEVALTVKAAAGYELDKLTIVDADGKNVMARDYKFRMPVGGVTVTATFKKIPYTVIISRNIQNGTVRADKATCGVEDEVALTIKPATGYELDKLTVKDAKGAAIAVENNKFTMPASAVEVSATFKKIQYTVKVADKIENGTVAIRKNNKDVTETKNVIGDTVTVKIAPAMGYKLKEVVNKVTGEKITVTKIGNMYSSEYTFTMDATDVTIEAVFESAMPQMPQRP